MNTAAATDEFDLVTLHYGGRDVALADLPQYRKFYGKLTSGRWEPHTLATLERYLDSDTVHVDIGAWIGVTPFYAAGIAKTVVAVDPDPDCIAILRRLAAGRPGVTVLQGALSDRPSVAIHAIDGFGSSETSVLDIGNGDSATVPGLRLDAIMAHAGDSPAFVKVDIEGYEYAMRGELARLDGGQVRAIQLAVHPQLYEKSLRMGRLRARLKTALETWRLGLAFGGGFSPPRLIKFSSLTAYIVFGILLRKAPKGADFLYESRTMSKARR